MVAKKKEVPPPASDIISLVAPNSAALIVKTPKERAALALRTDARELELTELVKKSADITEVLNADGRAQVHQMAMELKNARCDIKNKAQDARDDANKFSTAVIAEEKRLIAIVTAEETRVFKLRDDFDAKLAAEEAEKKRIEAERVASIRAKIDAIKALPGKSFGADSTAIRAVLTELAAREVEKGEFAELIGEAALALEVAGQELARMFDAAKLAEKAEADRLAAIEAQRVAMEHQAEANRKEAARLEKLRVEAEATEVERKRLAAVEQARIDGLAVEAQRKIDDANAFALAETNRLADERADFEVKKAAFAQAQADAARPVDVEAVQSAIEAEQAAPEPVAQLVVAFPEADPIELPDELPAVDVMEDGALVGALTDAVRAMVDAGFGPDAVRALVESVLTA